MDNKAHVDEVWTLLGTWGRYQVFLFAYMCFGMIPFAFTVLAIVFIGYAPDHECRPLSGPLSLYLNDSDIIDNDTNHRITYEQCHIQINVNTSNGTESNYQIPCLEGYIYHTEAPTIVTEWDLVCGSSGLGELTQTMVIMGQMIGALVFPSLADRYGRKPIFIINLFIVFAFSLSLAFVQQYYQYVILRVLIGTFLEGFGLAASIYMIEIFPKECRGRVSGYAAICWALSVILLSPFGYLLSRYSWRYLQIVIAIAASYGILGIWVLDESLRWLVANNKKKEAERIIRKAARWNKTDADLPLKVLFKEETMEVPLLEKSPDDDVKIVSNTMQNGTSDDVLIVVAPPTHVPPIKVERYNILTIIKDKVVLGMSIIMWFTWFTNSLTYYGLTLTSSKMAGNRFFNYFLTSLMELPAAFCYMFLIDRIGRKYSSILFHAIAGCSLVISVIMLVISGDKGTNNIISSVLSFIGKFAISSTFNIIFLYTPELYPTNLRVIGIGMASSVAKCGGMVAPYFGLLAAYAVWAPGVIFGMFCLLVTVLTTLLPETRGLELPQFIGELSLWYREQSKNTTWFKTKNKGQQRSTNQQK